MATWAQRESVPHREGQKERGFGDGQCVQGHGGPRRWVCGAETNGVIRASNSMGASQLGHAGRGVSGSPCRAGRGCPEWMAMAACSSLSKRLSRRRRQAWRARPSVCVSRSRGQQGTLLASPLLGTRAAACRTVPVAASQEGKMPLPAAGAAPERLPRRGGMTRLDRPHGAKLVAATLWPSQNA